MSAKKTGLGRGFESLIPTDLLDESFDPTAREDQQVSELRLLALSEVMPDPDQPRRTFNEEALAELAASISEHGILQPIVVTPQGSGYLIIAGERRYRAAGIAGLERVPALVRTVNALNKLELSLIENLQREDLNILETATAYLKLRDQFNLTLEEIGKRVGGRSVSSVSNTLRLLKLAPSVKQLLAEGTLTEGQARPLIGLDDSVVIEWLPQIVKEGWSARRIEQFIVDLKKGAVKNTTKPLRAQGDTYKPERDAIAERLHSDVTIRSNAKGAGQIIIKFKDQGDLERIQKLL